MKMGKAKSFENRMKFRAKHAGMAVGEYTAPVGEVGASAGERKMGMSKLNKQISAKKSSVSQSKDGNGGQ